MVQVLHLLGHCGDPELAQFTAQLKVDVQVPLDFFLELLGLKLNLLEFSAILLGDVGVELFKDLKKELRNVLFDLDSESLALSMLGCPLLLLVEQVEVAEVEILLLQTGPASLNTLVHPSEKLLQFSDQFKGTFFDIFFVESLSVITVSFLKFCQFLINHFGLLGGDGHQEGLDLRVGVLRKFFLLVI